MPVPYHRTPRAVTDGCAAFADVLSVRTGRAFYGGLLVLDGRGEPLEFVYNSLEAPSGFLWPEPLVAEASTVALLHSLFEACGRDPDLLVCRSCLAGAEVRRQIVPAIPFVVVSPPRGALPEERVWVNDPPGAGMRAAAVFQSLADRGFLLEPFDRIAAGLREVFPGVDWTGNRDDPP
jgi:hypothetical protein